MYDALSDQKMFAIRPNVLYSYEVFYSLPVNGDLRQRRNIDVGAYFISYKLCYHAYRQLFYTMFY